MVIYNGLVFTGEGHFAPLDLEHANGQITRLAPAGSLPTAGGLNAAGGYLLPGLVDIHTHGCAGGDFCDGDTATTQKMLNFYGQQGVTSVVAATMSLAQPHLLQAMGAMRPLFGTEGHGAVLRGVNLEGPFLSHKKCGAQNPEHLAPPSLRRFNELNAQSGGQIRLVDIAPELPGSLDFIAAVSGHCTVSLAHTAASYAEAEAAFGAGATHVTHLFNAMPPLHHREPGLIGAAGDYAAFVEVVSDGVHLHPSVVRAVFRWFGGARVCLVSDSMRATGMPSGRYTLGGLPVTLCGGRATLTDGTLAGSAATLAECCRRAVLFGVPLEQAICAATLNPARAVGLEHEVGRLAPGQRADILLWGQGLETRQVFSGGRALLP